MRDSPPDSDSTTSGRFSLLANDDSPHFPNLFIINCVVLLIRPQALLCNSIFPPSLYRPQTLAKQPNPPLICDQRLAEREVITIPNLPTAFVPALLSSFHHRTLHFLQALPAEQPSSM